MFPLVWTNHVGVGGLNIHPHCLLFLLQFDNWCGACLATPITTRPTLLLIFARRNQSAAPTFGFFLSLRTADKTNSAHTHNSNMQQHSALSKAKDK